VGEEFTTDGHGYGFHAYYEHLMAKGTFTQYN